MVEFDMSKLGPYLLMGVLGGGGMVGTSEYKNNSHAEELKLTIAAEEKRRQDTVDFVNQQRQADRAVFDKTIEVFTDACERSVEALRDSCRK